MKPPTVDEIRELLPEVDSIGPLVERLLTTARPDRSRRWSTSGELQTIGSRLVDLPRVARELPLLLDEVRTHLERTYGEIMAALEALAREDPETSAEHLLRAAEAERSFGRMREAGAFTEAAVRLTHRFRERGRATAVLIEGARAARAEGRWRDAEARYREASRIATAIGDAPSAARAAVGLGNLAVDRGLWQLALERYRGAERWVKTAREPLSERWHLPLNRSIVAREQGRLRDAEKELERARALAPLGEAEVGAVLGNAHGQVLRARERTEEAELAFRDALELSSGADARVTIASNLADALLAQGKDHEAERVAREAEDEAVRGSVVPRLPEVYSLLGRVAEARGHADAFVFFERALELAEQRKLPRLERARVLEAYAEHLRRSGEEEAAEARTARAIRIYRALGYDSAVQRLEGANDSRRSR